MFKIRIFPFLLLLLLVGCRKDSLIHQVTTIEDEPKILVVSSFKGKITDEAGLPVAGAVVRVYQNTVVTNGSGLFEFKNVKAPKGAALIAVEKPGYFTGSAMSGNTSGAQQFTRVTLVKKDQPLQVKAANGGTVTWPNGVKVTIPANSLRLTNGTVYTGDANVHARWLDPTDPQLGAIMPGALMAKDEDGNEKVLATYGMVAFQLEGALGQPLQLAEGKKADLELPIPTDLLPTAPEEIPLWLFDLEEERWLINGICNKTGGSYHCQVSQSGFWNCDVALEPICLSGTIYQSDSTPAIYTKVIVEDLTDNFIYWGYTNRDGFFCGSVPKGAPLKITIKDLCDNILYEMNIGPFSMDTDLGDIYLPQNLQQYLVRISGQLLDCAGAPVTDGQVAVVYPGKIRVFELTAPGVFDFQLALSCIEFPELQITGYDFTTFKSTATVLHSDESDLNTGVLTACTDPTDFIRLDADGTLHRLAPTRFYLKNNVSTNWMVLEGITTGGDIAIELRQYTGVGTYTANAFLHLNDIPPSPLYPVLQAASPDITVGISADDGQFISGTISGTAFDGFNNPHTVSGDFKVKKKF